MTTYKTFVQPGHATATLSYTYELNARIGIKPNTPSMQVVSRFLGWHRSYFKV
jgi:hypothetical protein